jgi:shikimate dehydrogenase
MGAHPQRIAATTRFCAVYGHPVRHSASPAMHGAALRELGLDWGYLAFDVHPENLAAALRGARAMKFIGLNLTVPHKLLALDLVDELDESARTWGAVNTILFEGRSRDETWQPLRVLNPDEIFETRARGFNTDADAITRSIEEDLRQPIKGTTALLLGAGGAGRTAALKLASSGVKRLYLINRTMAKAREIAAEITGRWPAVDVNASYPPGPVDLAINATSLGLRAEDHMPFDASQFALNRAGAAYDMIYQPAETPFLRAAAQAGCAVSNGLGMLLYQGAKALEIWTGTEAPVEIMRAALREHVYGAD